MLATVVLAASALARAQDDAPEIRVQVNYVYATQFGFGAYDVGDLRVNVYTLPLSYTFEHVYRDWDLRILFPITYGRYRFRTTLVFDGQPVGIRASTNTIAAEPKLRLDIPILPGLRVSPFGGWGLGTTFDSSGRVRVRGATEFRLNSSESLFYTWQVGYTALYEYDWRAWRLFLGNALIGAGDQYFDASDDVEHYGTLRNGIEVRRPLGFEILGRLPDAGVFFIYDHFFPSLQFTRVRRAALEVDDLFEIGATIGSATPLDLPWIGDMLDNLRLGVSYQTGDGLDAWKLSTGFPF